MNSEFGELAQARYRTRSTYRKVLTVGGVLLVAVGYALMCVSPDTSLEWAFFRVMAGLGCIVVGCSMVLLLVFSQRAQAD